ncbi:MAG TPA: four helix bundle protein [Longimicrobiales bacterium]|nr:four helix bundle protein [Longimicrobiales bacterium]
MSPFDFRRLDAYRLAIEFVGAARSIIAALPRGEGHLADQLYRASTSIVLNVAEGSGEFRSAEKARFYRIARRSGSECAAILDILAAHDLAAPDAIDAGVALLDRIVAMLTRMVLKAEEAP